MRAALQAVAALLAWAAFCYLLATGTFSLEEMGALLVVLCGLAFVVIVTRGSR
jgi:hypothetical protein